MEQKPYVKISGNSTSFFFGVFLAGVLVAIVPFLLHLNLNDFKEDIQGPCFAAISGREHSEINVLRNPGRYSGYSIIIDTVRSENTLDNKDLPVPPKKKEQTMMINGKEYILK